MLKSMQIAFNVVDDRGIPIKNIEHWLKRGGCGRVQLPSCDVRGPNSTNLFRIKSIDKSLFCFESFFRSKKLSRNG